MTEEKIIRKLNKYAKQLAGTHTLTKPVVVSNEELIEYLPKLTKVQIELIGRGFGIEVDRRKTKATIVEQVVAAIHEYGK